MRPLGLYLHIPFCKAKCIYCDFYSLPHSEEKMDAYTAALQRDLIRWANQAKGHTVDTIYFGGGTPSYLGAERLCRLLETVFAHYRVDKNAEITTEANPDSAREVSALRQLREAGFNRISLGMQSASDDELRLIGRVHTHKETVEAVHAARAAGFDNVSLDLIYGLPEQTMARWRENLQAAIALEPEHLSCYGLKIEEGTPLDRKKDALRIPDDDEQAEEYLATVELRRNGALHSCGAGVRAFRPRRRCLTGWLLGWPLRIARIGCMLLHGLYSAANRGGGKHRATNPRRRSWRVVLQGVLGGLSHRDPCVLCGLRHLTHCAALYLL